MLFLSVLVCFKLCTIQNRYIQLAPWPGKYFSFSLFLFWYGSFYSFSVFGLFSVSFRVFSLITCAPRGPGPIARNPAGAGGYPSVENLIKSPQTTLDNNIFICYSIVKRGGVRNESQRSDKHMFKRQKDE